MQYAATLGLDGNPKIRPIESKFEEKQEVDIGCYLADGWGHLTPEEDLYMAHYGKNCAECGSKWIGVMKPP